MLAGSFLQTLLVPVQVPLLASKTRQTPAQMLGWAAASLGPRQRARQHSRRRWQLRLPLTCLRHHRSWSWGKHL